MYQSVVNPIEIGRVMFPTFPQSIACIESRPRRFDFLQRQSADPPASCRVRRASATQLACSRASRPGICPEVSESLSRSTGQRCRAGSQRSTSAQKLLTSYSDRPRAVQHRSRSYSDRPRSVSHPTQIGLDPSHRETQPLKRIPDCRLLTVIGPSAG